MLRVMAAAGLALCVAPEAMTQTPVTPVTVVTMAPATPRELVDTGVEACIRFMGSASTTLPDLQGFKDMGQGIRYADAEGVRVLAVGQVNEDTATRELVGVCKVQAEGIVIWFPAYAADLNKALTSEGWNAVPEQSGVKDGVRTYALAGLGAMKIEHAEDGGFGLVSFSWTE